MQIASLKHGKKDILIAVRPFSLRPDLSKPRPALYKITNSAKSLNGADSISSVLLNAILSESSEQFTIEGENNMPVAIYPKSAGSLNFSNSLPTAKARIAMIVIFKSMEFSDVWAKS